jgi:uncharacterized membrane protein YGL010W
MKSVQDQLSTYKSVHLNKKNVITHFIGVPLIIWSLLVLLSLIKLPIEMPIIQLPLTISMAFFAAILVYYFFLNITLAIAALMLLSPILYSAILVAEMEQAVWIALVIFIVAWIIQFVGHHFEKAKPAFIDDLNQLLIGPLFLLAELIFALGGLTKLKNEITPMAINKRRQFEKAKAN